MKVFFKEITFPSTQQTYIQDITDVVQEAVRKSKADAGFVLVNTLHTTLGIVVNEIAEPNLLQDILRHGLVSVPEDKRSTKVHDTYEHPVTDYRHRCQDNPFCNEIDEDYNAAAHIRALTFSHPSTTLPIRDGKVVLGKYQQIALYEFDGRDGKGKNPIRQRKVQIWIYPAYSVTTL